MNVAILMPRADQRGGAEQLLRQLMGQMQDRETGITWLVVFFEEGPMRDELDALGIKTRLIRTGRLREVGRYVAAVRQIASLLHRQQVDLVFSWMSKAHLYGGLAAWLAGRPAAWYQHGLPDPPGVLDQLITLLPAQHVVACSQAAADAQNRLWPARPTRVVHPCVDLTRFCPEQLAGPDVMRQRLGLPEDGPLVGIVGRLQRWKGIHVFLDALSLVLQAYPEAHGVIVGGRHDLEPDYADEVEAKIVRMRLEGHVTMAGFQSNVPDWMHAMDVVVHASDGEPFGMVVIEAMALGKPVVAGSTGGPQEIISEGVDGLLAPYENADVLAQQVLRFLDDRDFRRAVGDAARKRAQAFASDRYATDFASTIRLMTREREHMAPRA